jgi:secreted Zn-dependent insulinase-like peptidase
LRGLSVKILSKRYDPVHMQGEVDAFFNDYSATILPNLSQEEVSSLANSLILSLSEPPKSYLEESNDFWNDIMNDMPHDWVEQVKTELKSANKDLLIKYITEVLTDSPTHSLTHSLSHSLTHLLTYLLTHLLTYLFAQWLYNPAKSNQVTVMLFGKDRSIPAIDAITTLAGMTAFRQELPFYEINK